MKITRIHINFKIVTTIGVYKHIHIYDNKLFINIETFLLDPTSKYLICRLKYLLVLIFDIKPSRKDKNVIALSLVLIHSVTRIKFACVTLGKLNTFFIKAKELKIRK